MPNPFPVRFCDVFSHVGHFGSLPKHDVSAGGAGLSKCFCLLVLLVLLVLLLLLLLFLRSPAISLGSPL